MTNPVATIALTYAATDVQHSDFGIFLEVVRGLNDAPTTRGMDITVPGRAFMVRGSHVANKLLIELRGVVMGTSDADFRTNVKAVRTLFDPTRAPANLVATLEDGTTATVSAHPVNLLWNQSFPSVAELSVELTAYGDWVIT